jgi:hypothetical protein
MKLNYKLIIAFAALLLMIPWKGFGQEYSKSRYEKRVFAVGKNTEVQIANKYGNIHVYEWEKDSVKIEIDLEVKANKESKMEKTYDMIDFEFTSTNYYVIAKTNFKSSQGSFWGEVSDLASTIFSSNNKAEINFKVHVPKACHLKLENKFGNIYMTDHKGKTEIILSNGNLKAFSFTGDLDLKLDFGDVNIKMMEDAKITASYANMEIGEANEIILESKSSEYEIAVIEKLSVASRRDKFDIEELAELSGDMSFSEIKVDYFSAESVLTTNYGDMNIGTIGAGFRKFQLDARYTEVNLNFEPDAAFIIDLEYTGKTSLSLPVGFEKDNEAVIDQKEDVLKTTGKVGDGGKLPRVIIKIESGQVSITNY